MEEGRKADSQGNFQTSVTKEIWLLLSGMWQELFKRRTQTKVPKMYSDLS